MMDDHLVGIIILIRYNMTVIEYNLFYVQYPLELHKNMKFAVYGDNIILYIADIP